mgnify:CR=1 FL=1
MHITIDPAGFVSCLNHRWRCALGRGAIVHDKIEGDGASPAGTWALGRVFYRPDRGAAPQTGLTVVALHPKWGWCDDPAHADYNRLVTLPHPARHEILWRDDALYDVVVELLYNTDPIISDRGSAIFMHVAKPDYSPTEGCIALNLKDLKALLQLCNDGDTVTIPD